MLLQPALLLDVTELSIVPSRTSVPGLPRPIDIDPPIRALKLVRNMPMAFEPLFTSRPSAPNMAASEPPVVATEVSSTSFESLITNVTPQPAFGIMARLLTLLITTLPLLAFAIALSLVALATVAQPVGNMAIGTRVADIVELFSVLAEAEAMARPNRLPQHGGGAMARALRP